jgi:hypothetical protein
MTAVFIRINQAISYTLKYYEIGHIANYLSYLAGEPNLGRFMLSPDEAIFRFHELMEDEINQTIHSVNSNTQVAMFDLEEYEGKQSGFLPFFPNNRANPYTSKVTNYSYYCIRIKESTEWDYVPNQGGGFLGFWYHWTWTEEVGEIYIQIENMFDLGIKLVIKVGDWDGKINTLYTVLNEIKPIGEKNNLSLLKPDKFRAGTKSTLGVVQNAFLTDENGVLNIPAFLDTLNNLEHTLDDYCNSKNG